MMLLELDPNVVKPGWIPLLITIGLALVMVLLFRSMRRQFRRVDAHYPPPTEPGTGPAEDASSAGPAADGIITGDRPGAPTGANPTPDERTRSR